MKYSSHRCKRKQTPIRTSRPWIFGCVGNGLWMCRRITWHRIMENKSISALLKEACTDYSSGNWDYMSINRGTINWNKNWRHLDTMQDTMKKTVLKMLRGTLSVNVLRPECAWRLRESKNAADVPTKVFTRTWEVRSAPYNKQINKTRNDCIGFNKAELVT